MLDIIAIWKAWGAGKEIANPEKWKTGTELTNLISLIVAGIAAVIECWYPGFVTEQMLNLLTGIFIGVLVLINVISNRITTKKAIGLSVLKGK